MQAVLALSLITLLLVAHPGVSTAESPTVPTPTCAWPFELTPFGLGNWFWPDTAARYWFMPIDAHWHQLTMTGVYAQARYFSFVVYDDAPVPTEVADHLFDAHIVPDPGRVNPFATPDPSAHVAAPEQTYTITVTRTDNTAGNVLRLHAETGWLVYRLYLPNAGEDSMGGVPLPEVGITDASGRTTPLPTCPIVNRQSEVVQLQPQLVPAVLEHPPQLPPVPDRLWFGPPAVPPVRLMPNPDNKYLASFFMSEYEPGRLIVMRGKMPAFPDTYHGQPVSQPAPGFETVQVRYWSVCQADLVSPMPTDGCATDASTPLDETGFYTIVISNDVIRPDWLPETVVWLPWGDEQLVPKLIFVRNQLPSADFHQAVQDAVAQGCGFDFTFPTPPPQDDITRSGQCAQGVMGDYYPVAVWCDRQTFMAGGWPACFRAAQVP